MENVATISRKARHWIGGKWREIGSQMSSCDPATGKSIGVFFDGGGEAAKAAIEAARAAFEANDVWRMDGTLRAAALARLAEAFAERRDELSQIICLENGKLKYEAEREISGLIRLLRYTMGLSTQTHGRVLDSAPGKQAMCLRQPVGVAGLIVPWNAPSYLSIRAIAPALAAGCSTVVKFPAQSAQTADLLAHIFDSVKDIPSGFVNMFVEAGSAGAQLLVQSPVVRVINFTGSTRIGIEVARAAAVHLKRVGLELGGKTPNIIFADADIDAALPILEKSVTTFAGQFCMTGSRILVQQTIAKDVASRLGARLSAAKPGPASDPSSDMGPMIDRANVVRVDQMVEQAIAAGAKVIVRGGPAVEPSLRDGAFYHPTMLEVTDSSLSIVQEEIFGPVLTLQTFDTEEEAIALANDNPFGLSASIWTRDASRSLRLSRRLDAGLISINSWANLAMEMEEGGFKNSGSGRLGGIASLDDFLEYKQITQDYA
ncbi:aldehyde dehydrogenase family protein [Bradyrhizobium sp. WSM3983]|uniref:aldehyde dehydrogenase family protein n=1 Tax=Bradyrhizobium sp. WSM3983 TaxID=1038867 RepID=UPI00040F24D5|nr:aldehyde dehydrogenase family protein [Bradyrhizobium sp. WSM3983]